MKGFISKWKVLRVADLVQDWIPRLILRVFASWHRHLFRVIGSMLDDAGVYMSEWSGYNKAQAGSLLKYQVFCDGELEA